MAAHRGYLRNALAQSDKQIHFLVSLGNKSTALMTTMRSLRSYKEDKAAQIKTHEEEYGRFGILDLQSTSLFEIVRFGMERLDENPTQHAWAQIKDLYKPPTP